MSLSVPYLEQFMGNKGNLKFGGAWVAFHEEGVSVWMYPHEGARDVCLPFGNRRQTPRLAGATQVFYALRKLMWYLTLAYHDERHLMPSGWNNEADRTQWRNILRSFGNVKTLVVRKGLVKELSRSLLERHLYQHLAERW
jgi:hypothetical protein